MIVLGSQAMMRFVKPTTEVFERLQRADFDVIMSKEEFKSWCEINNGSIKSLYPTQGNKFKAYVTSEDGTRKMYEIEIGEEGTSSKFLLDNLDAVTYGHTHGHLGELLRILRPEWQMLTKRSHLIYPVHFEKNINDYHTLRSLVGYYYRTGLMDEYYKLRSAEAKERYGNKAPRLNVTNEDFFDSKLPVDTYFIHDDIHAVMAHHDKPVYEMMKREEKMDLAWCEKDLFFELPYDYQIQAVQEEAYVIALERYIIPQFGDDCGDVFKCYKNAVKRICTTLTSGWFRKFAIENYPVVIERYNPLFVEKFEDAFGQGKILPKQGVSKKNIPFFSGRA